MGGRCTQSFPWRTIRGAAGLALVPNEWNILPLIGSDTTIGGQVKSKPLIV